MSIDALEPGSALSNWNAIDVYDSSVSMLLVLGSEFSYVYRFVSTEIISFYKRDFEFFSIGKPVSDRMTGGSASTRLSCCGTSLNDPI